MSRKSGKKKKRSDYDEKKFVSEEAETMYLTYLLFKPLIPERGFLNPGGSIGETNGTTNELLKEWRYAVSCPLE